MIFEELFERFLSESPLCVMQRVLLENVFAPAKLDAVFHSAAVRQYQRELLFSHLVDLTSLVTCRVQPSVRAAYRHKQKLRQGLPASLRALYDKLSGVEPQTSQALVRYAASAAGELIDRMGGAVRPLLPGYRVRILDGNHLAGTDRRLKVLRGTAAGALPGQALVLLDPQRMVVDDVFPCEDGHAQERSLLHQVLPHLRPRDLLIDDRNFCTAAFLAGMARRRVRFVTRQHGRLPYRLLGQRRPAGRCPTGRVYEQPLVIREPGTGAELLVRRVTVRLQVPTRDGDTEVHLLTNLPASKVKAAKVARLYQERWRLETAFHELTVHLRCELSTLGYPPAALFAFCVALCCYNLLAAIKGALRAAHGPEAVAQGLSSFYLADEVSGVYRGMMIALPPAAWARFQGLGLEELAELLKGWAGRTDLSGYRKATHRARRVAAKRTGGHQKHVATAKLLPKKRLIVRTRRPPAAAADT